MYSSRLINVRVALFVVTDFVATWQAKEEYLSHAFSFYCIPKQPNSRIHCAELMSNINTRLDATLVQFKQCHIGQKSKPNFRLTVHDCPTNFVYVFGFVRPLASWHRPCILITTLASSFSFTPHLRNMRLPTPEKKEDVKAKPVPKMAGAAKTVAPAKPSPPPRHIQNIAPATKKTDAKKSN